MRTFVIGDIHGQYDKLKTILELAQVNDDDRIIQLGDIVDRGPHPFECIDLLLKWKNVIFIRGNHDDEFEEVFLKQGQLHFGGAHGARDTSAAWYALNDQPEKQAFYRKFFATMQKDYYIDENNRCYVHGGFNRHFPITEQSKIQYYWDRDLLTAAMSFNSMNYEDKNKYKFKIKDNFKEIFLGHTPTTYWGVETPMFLCNKIWNLDTGSGKGGLLTIMNADTKEYWQA